MEKVSTYKNLQIYALGKSGFFDSIQFNFLFFIDEDTRTPKRRSHLLCNQQKTLLFHDLSLPPSLKDSTCFTLSARNTMYTQQKPSWVSIRKKLTIYLEERREKEGTFVINKRVGLSFSFLSPGVGGSVSALLFMPPQSTMGQQ